MSDSVRPLRIPRRVRLCAADPPFAKADGKGSWTLAFVLARDVPADQGLRLCVHGGRNMKLAWSGLQTEDRARDGYLSLRTKAGDVLASNGRDEGGGLFSFAVPPRGLRQGENTVVEIRNTVAPRLSHPGKFFLLMAASPDDELKPPTLCGEALEGIVGACVMDVVGGDPATLRILAPSTAIPGREVSLLIRPEDKNRNVASSPPGELIVRLNGRHIPARRMPVEGSACCRLDGIILPDEGVFRLEVEDTATGFKAITNPISCVKSSETTLLWGSMHGHTEISDGSGSLDRYFTQMRDECAIDFAATGDHDKADETPEELWKMSQQAVVKYNEPGRFTVFLGYEWARWRRRGDGDKNIYYLHDRRPMFRSDDDAYPAPPDLYRALKDEAALIMPHHSAHMGNHCDWKDHDPEKERLVEIYSLWGCSERSIEDGNIHPGDPVDNPKAASGMNPLGYVQRGLEMGWRVGFTANSDDHAGHPADLTTRGRGQTGGLTAVYAESNTREAIWDALMSRRCYGTTGERIIVDFRLDDCPMGSEIRVSERPDLAPKRRLSICVHGTARIATVEIVRNNRDVHVVKPGALDCEFEWTDAEPLSEVNLPPNVHSPVPFTFYYLRVTQEDRHMAWSSPIWISK